MPDNPSNPKAFAAISIESRPIRPQGSGRFGRGPFVIPMIEKRPRVHAVSGHCGGRRHGGMAAWVRVGARVWWRANR